MEHKALLIKIFILKGGAKNNLHFQRFFLAANHCPSYAEPAAVEANKSAREEDKLDDL